MAVLPSDTLFILNMVGPKKLFFDFPSSQIPQLYNFFFKNDTKKSKLLTKNPLRAATLKLNIVFKIGRSAKNLI